MGGKGKWGSKPFRTGKGRWFALLGGAGLLLVYLFAGLDIGQTETNQPIRFNHQVHVKKEPCKTCHRFYETRQVAGRPDLFLCMECHTNPVTEKEEENILRRLAENRQPLRWNRLARLPSHVRFSHQRHIVVGKVECRICHGAIAQTTAPPDEPLVSIDMNFCQDCHRSEKVYLNREAIKAIEELEVGQDTLEALISLRNKRFSSRGDFLAGLNLLLNPPSDAATEQQSAQQAAQPAESTVSTGSTGITGITVPPAEEEIILKHLQEARPVTVDCIACHL